VPDLTGTTDLVQTVGYKRALEICLTSRWVTGAEAERIGIAIDCVPADELAARTDALVAVLTSRIPGTCSATKTLLRAGTTATSTEQRLNERVSQRGRLSMLTKMME
jgi:enoyl-CoA hydratase/carnithine racemase